MTATQAEQMSRRFPHLSSVRRQIREATGRDLDEGLIQTRRAYVPQGALDLFMGCKHQEVLLEGPAGTGKSRGALQKLHYCCSKRYPGI